MKAKTFTQNTTLNRMGLLGLFFIIALLANPIAAQDATRTIKGKVSDEIGPLENAVVVLKGTDKGVATDANGLFTFPELLKDGDVLVFSYLGYEKQEITIAPGQTFIDLVLTEDNIQIFEALMVEDVKKVKKSKDQ